MVSAQGIELGPLPREGSAPRPLAGHFDAEFAGFAGGCLAVAVARFEPPRAFIRRLVADK
jgi:hypothetical protein